jgi:hypothetical protein
MNQWLKHLRRLLESSEIIPDDPLASTAAHPASEEAEVLHVGKRRIKENYTSHWDLDYLPRAEVDIIFGETEKDKSGG